MSKKTFLLFLFVILFFGGFLRLYKLGDIPVSLYWDEVAMLADARFVAETGLDMHGNHWLQAMYLSYGDYKLPAYIWLATIAVKLFGVSEFALRFPSFIAGFLTIIVGGIISTELFKYFYKFKNGYLKILFLATTFVIAFSPWGILFSRTGFEGHLGQFFLGSAVLFTIFALKKDKFLNYKSILLIIIAQLFAGLATYSYFSVRFVWLVIFPLLAILMKYQKPKAMATILCSLVIYFLLLMPMLNNHFYQASNDFRLSTTSVINMKDWGLESNMLREQAGNNYLARLFYHRHVLMLQELAKNYSSHLSINYIFISGDSNLRHGTGQHGLFLLTFFPFFLAGLYYLFSKYKKIFLFIGVWWLIALLPASVPDTTPHALRSLNAFLPISMIIGIGLAEFVIYILNKKSLVLNIFSYGYLILIIFSIINFAIFYFQQYPQISAPNWQYGFKEVVLEINDHNKDIGTVWINLTDARFFLWHLAYGDVSLESTQENLKNQSFPDVIDNVSYVKYNWDQLDSLDHRMLVVGSYKEMETQLESALLNPVWEKHIYNLDNEKLYTLVKFGE